MAKTCDFKTSEASTKAWMRKRKLLTNFLEIPESNLTHFRQQNSYWSKKAFQRHHQAGIKPGDMLFYEEPGAKKVMPNTEMFHRIDADKGNFYQENLKYASEVSLSASLSQPAITISDRVVFGHPTIGKSYLKKDGDNRFISLDDDYSKEIVDFVEKIAKMYNVTTYQVKDGGTQEWNKEYNKQMQKLFDFAKKTAITQSKTLFTSNTNLLKNNLSSFDKVVNLTDKEFERRIKERQSKGGAKYDIQEWKSQINAVMSKVPANKLITTEQYLSDLLIPSKELSDKFVDDLYNLNLTPEVITYLYNENGSSHKLLDYGFMLNEMVNSLKSQNRSFVQILDDIKCL